MKNDIYKDLDSIRDVIESIIGICDQINENNRENSVATIKCKCNDAIEYINTYIIKPKEEDNLFIIL